MSGNFTRKIYDGCAYSQYAKQTTDPMNYRLDPAPFVHCDNICQPNLPIQPESALLVDLESSLWGLDKTASKCDRSMHPFCSDSGCILTNDSRVGPHITPYACERGPAGSKSVIQTNMRMPATNGQRLPPAACNDGNQNYASF